MSPLDVLQPIHAQLNYWINYQIGQSKCLRSHQEHNEYRKNHDLDCILTNGNLLADTIFSLWRPLRYTLVRINGYTKLNKYGKVEKSVPFLKAINEEKNLRELLPANNPVVVSLSDLFCLGRSRSNVMILPAQELNSLRGKEPYHDYMPYFLSECFLPGEFSSYFHGDINYKKWIDREHLGMFFNGEYCKENIFDLSGSGSIKNGIPPIEDSITSLKTMLDNYIYILQEREKYI